MLPFLWILAAMGVAYWAKLDNRNAFFWFVISVVLSPLVGSLLLWAFDRYNFRI